MEIVAASPEDAHELAPLVTAWRHEVLGDDEPACSPEEAAAWFRPRLDRRRVAVLARAGDAAVGVARLHLRTDRPIPAFAPELFVTPEARRQGVGRALVDELAALARQAGASRLVLRQDDSNDGAAAFADAVGATLGFRGLQNRCRTSRLDPAQLSDWVHAAQERLPGWSLVGWDGPCPDDLLDPFVTVHAAMHGAPVPDIAVTERSADDIRAAEASEAALGTEHWVLAARRDSDGELGGFTELLFETERPWLASQGDTGVLPSFRGLGLGRWLKAAMALRLLADRPSIEQIETNTAEDNPHMRAINEAMGFEVAVVWQDRELALD